MRLVPRGLSERTRAPALAAPTAGEPEVSTALSWSVPSVSAADGLAQGGRGERGRPTYRMYLSTAASCSATVFEKTWVRGSLATKKK